jgi:hypothetical protein
MLKTNKLYQFGINNIKFYYKSCSKIEIRKVYNPTSFIGKFAVNFGFSFFFKFLGKKEVEKTIFSIIDFDKLKILLIGNNKSKPKYIALERHGNNYTYKKFSINNIEAADDIKNEIYFHEEIKNTIFVPERIKNQVVLNSYSNNSTTCIVTKELAYKQTNNNSNINYVFLNYFFKEFSLKNIEKVDNDFTYCHSHGDLTPWNVKHDDDNFILLDWEDYGVRPLYYDIIQYQFSFYCIYKYLSFNESKKWVILNLKFLDTSINEHQYLQTMTFFQSHTYLK